MKEREDPKDWDEHLGDVEYAQLVGAQRVMGVFRHCSYEVAGKPWTRLTERWG